MKVLVVDDHAGSREVLVATLDADGYTVFTAANGEECVRCAEREMPDVILLDVMMPDATGYEVCTRLRSMPQVRETAIIMVTALTDRESRLAGFEAGADDFLSKPIDRLELKLRLKTLAQLGRYRALLEERSRAAELSRLSHDAIISLDRRGYVVASNPTATRLFGTLDNRTLLDLFPPTEHESLRRDWQDLLMGHVDRIEIGATLKGASGDQPAQVSIGAVDPGPGGILAIVVIRDEAERHALRRRVQQSQQLESIGRATSGLAHDFADALMAIRGAISQAANRLEPTHPAREPLGDATTLIDDTARLIRRVNRVGPAVPAHLAVDLVEELRVIEPFLRHLADGISLDVSYPPSSAWIDIDPTELRQVLTNLVSNARDATADEGSIAIRVYAGRSTSGATSGALWWFVDVADSGRGMPPEVLARVFEPYFTTKGESGTGIGLTTANDIVTRHGGTITAASHPNRGTTFTIGFPAALVTTMAAPKR
jgi:signal transduction histidine kinase